LALGGLSQRLASVIPGSGVADDWPGVGRQSGRGVVEVVVEHDGERALPVVTLPAAVAIFTAT
jgi:hypothetical protein